MSTEIFQTLIKINTSCHHKQTIMKKLLLLNMVSKLGDEYHTVRTHGPVSHGTCSSQGYVFYFSAIKATSNPILFKIGITVLEPWVEGP